MVAVAVVFNRWKIETAFNGGGGGGVQWRQQHSMVLAMVHRRRLTTGCVAAVADAQA